MTIIDAHTHMPGSSFTGIKGLDSGQFISLLDENDIDQAWVFTLDGLFFDPKPHNDRLRAFCDEAPTRLIPFCTVHPRYPDAVEEFYRCIHELKMKGLKLHPWTQAFSPTDPIMDALGEAASDLNVPIVFWGMAGCTICGKRR